MGFRGSRVRIPASRPNKSAQNLNCSKRYVAISEEIRSVPTGRKTGRLRILEDLRGFSFGHIFAPILWVVPKMSETRSKRITSSKRHRMATRDVSRGSPSEARWAPRITADEREAARRSADLPSAREQLIQIPRPTVVRVPSLGPREDGSTRRAEGILPRTRPRGYLPAAKRRLRIEPNK